MLSRKCATVLFSALLLALCAFADTSSQAAAQKKNRPSPQPTPEPQRPPTLSVQADSEVVTLCPETEALANPRVRLKAIGSSPDGNTLRYGWSVTGGRIEGDGTDVVWDLSNARPGVYTATATIESGPVGDPLCTAFTSTKVVVRNCPPPRPLCPNISTSCPDVTQAGMPVTFTASASGGTPGVTPVYNWKISAGTITAGQGTPTITVDTTGLGGQPITASVEVEGYGSLVCRASCQSAVPAPVQARKSNEIGEVKRDEEKALLDLFAIELQNEPGAKGHIIGYGSRNSKRADGERRAARARDYLVTARGIESDRIVVVDGGFSESGRTELWVVPQGATTPRPR